jgi:hypothetical protein
MLLPENVEPVACCSGTLVPPLASRNSTPTVQLSVIWFSVSVVLSVWFRKSSPVRLLVITLLWTELPFELLMSIAVRLPSKREFLTSTLAVWPCTATPPLFSAALFQSVALLPARVIVKPSMTTGVGTPAVT